MKFANTVIAGFLFFLLLACAEAPQTKNTETSMPGGRGEIAQQVEQVKIARREEFLHLKERYDRSQPNQARTSEMRRMLAEGPGKENSTEIDCRGIYCAIDLTYSSESEQISGQDAVMQWLARSQGCGFHIFHPSGDEQQATGIHQQIFLHCRQ
jgi:hypothetical protein